MISKDVVVSIGNIVSIIEEVTIRLSWSAIDTISCNAKLAEVVAF